MGEDIPPEEPRDLDEESSRARRLLDENDSGDQYRNPKAELLSDERDRMKLAIEQIDHKKLGKKLKPLYLALGDVYALSDPSRPSFNDYVRSELNSKIRIPVAEEVPKKEMAAYSAKAISVLQNAITRVRTNPVTMARNTLPLKGFQLTYESDIWANPTDTKVLLNAIDTAYEVIKIICNRETAVRSAGDADARMEADRADEAEVFQWLNMVKEEFIAQGKIKRKRDAADAIRDVMGRVDKSQ